MGQRMTHAETQDVLLDLVYDELEPERAEEARLHLAACEECRREKAEIDRTRRMTAAVRENEEPPAHLDEGILRAARAQAQLEHDGNIGEVIDVSGTVKPLGIEAKDVDVTAPLKVRPARPRRSRWLMPAAVGGSLAAAAALALVFGTALEPKRTGQLADRGQFQIRVQPAGEEDRSAPAAPQPMAEKQAAPPSQAAEPQPPALARKRTRPTGSGGDADGPVRSGAASAQNYAQSRSAERIDSTSGGSAALEGTRGAAPDPGTAALPSARPAADASRKPAPSESAQPKALARAAAPASPAGRAEGAEETPELLEQRAREVRHAADYAQAALLYRRAAELHRARGAATSAAAWDLAHAVECLAASGQFDEARAVRDELSASYPGEETARAAAVRVLRTVEPAAPAARSRPEIPAQPAPIGR